MGIKNIVRGGISNIVGSNFEGTTLKKIISSSKPGDKIASQIILDFPVLSYEELLIYEVKNYKEVSTGIKKAKESFSKYEISEYSKLIIITSQESKDPYSEFLKPGSTSKNFKNTSIGINTVDDVEEVFQLLFGLMSSGYYIDMIKEWIDSGDETVLKADIKAFAMSKEGKITKFFIPIDKVVHLYETEIKNGYSSFVEQLKNEEEYSNREIQNKLLQDLFERNWKVQQIMEEENEN